MARLILLPGLGADERALAGIGPLCLPLVAARLPIPAPREPMPHYSLRVAERLELRPGDWIGGCSFGGMVAADIARRRPVAGLVLVGSALSSAGLVAPITWLAVLRRLLPMRALHPLLATRTVLSLAFGTVPAPQMQLLADMLTATPNALLREGARLATRYRPTIAPLCPVYAIHGQADRFMKPPPVAGCVRLAGAGHALALTHPQAVSEFLDKVICRR